MPDSQNRVSPAVSRSAPSPPLSKEAGSFTGDARKLTALERQAWLWNWGAAGCDSASKLAMLLLRWRVDIVLFVVEVLRVTPLPYQVKILLDFAGAAPEVYARYGVDFPDVQYQVVVPSGHGLGKTRTMAMCLWWMLITHKFSRVLVTAPTADQLTGQLWGEVRKMHRRMKKGAVPALADEWNVLAAAVQHVNPDFGDWVALARTARADKPEGMQGAHGIDDDDEFGDIAELFGEEADSSDSGGIAVIIEEASGVPAEIFEVLDGALSEEGARCLQCGNPTRNDGRFAENTQNPGRFSIVNLDCRISNREEIYTVPHVNFGGSLKHLRVRGRVRPSYWNEILAECDGDENADRFRVRVRGLVPRSNSEQICKTAWVKAALERRPSDECATKPAVVGIDFGLTSDKHGLAVRRGYAMIDGREWLPKDKPSEVTLDAAEAVKDAVLVHKAKFIVGDANGVGRGAMELLKKYYREDAPELGVKVIFFNAGAGSKKKRYVRKRDEMWHFHARSWVSDPRCSLMDMPGLQSQITAPGCFENDRNQISAETKKEILKRTGQRSGNIADGLFMSLMANENSAIKVVVKPSKPKFSPAFTEHFARLNASANSGNYIHG